jgi:hypothetical protein
VTLESARSSVTATKPLHRQATRSPAPVRSATPRERLGAVISRIGNSNANALLQDRKTPAPACAVVVGGVELSAPPPGTGDVGTVVPALKIGSANDPLVADAERFADEACCGSEPVLVGLPDDAFELEADRVAAQVTQAGFASPVGQIARSSEARLQQAKAAGADSVERATAPPIVYKGLSSPGQPLDAATRAFMEPRFGKDFSRVRIHTDHVAQQSAKDVNAHAYTVGSDIVFGRNQYQPETHTGRSLLAHELMHVLQSPASPTVLRRQPVAHEGSAKSVDLNSVQCEISYYHFGQRPLLLKFGRWLDKSEVLGLVFASGALPPGATLEGEGVQWQLTPPRSFATLTPAFQDIFTQVVSDSFLTVDRDDAPTTIRVDLHRASTLQKPLVAQSQKAALAFVVAQTKEQKAASAEFAQLSPAEKRAINCQADEQFWRNTRDKTRHVLGTAPEDQKLALYWVQLRTELIEKKQDLADLPLEILAVIGENVQPADYDTVLRIAEKLKTLTPEELSDYLGRTNASTGDWHKFEASVDAYLRHRAERAAHERHLNATEDDLADLEDVYRAYLHYKEAPSYQGVNKAAVDLADYWADSKRALDSALAAHGITLEQFEERIEAYQKAFRDEAVAVASDALARLEHWMYEEKKRYDDPQNQLDLARSLGIADADAEGETTPAEKNPPVADFRTPANRRSDPRLIDAPGFDKDRLRAHPEQLQSIVAEYVSARSRDIADFRTGIRTKPDHIFELEELISALLESRGQTGTIYAQLINQYPRDSHPILNALGLIVAVALFLIPGGSWLGAILLFASSLLSTYNAIEQYEKYKVDLRDYRLRFLTEKPSRFWVVVSFAAAALDIGSAGAALSKVRPAIEAFSDSEKTVADFEKFTKKIEEAGLQKEQLDALKAGAQQQTTIAEAWLDLLGDVSSRAGSAGGALQAVPKLFKFVWTSLKNGLSKAAILAKEEEYARTLRSIGQDLGLSKQVLEKSLVQIEEIISIGNARRMGDEAQLRYVSIWASKLQEGEPSFQAFKESMRNWTPEYEAALNARQEIMQELNDLTSREANVRAQLADPKNASPEKQRELTQELQEIQEDKPWAESRKTDLRHKLKVANQDVDRYRGSLYDRLRASKVPPAVRDKVLTGYVDRVGPLLKNSGEVTLDHLVSVKEFSELDGVVLLSPADREAILNAEENLIAMDGLANSTKGDNPWAEWDGWRQFYSDPNTQIKMVEVESRARKFVLDKIAEALARKGVP